MSLSSSPFILDLIDSKYSFLNTLCPAADNEYSNLPSLHHLLTVMGDRPNIFAASFTLMATRTPLVKFANYLTIVYHKRIIYVNKRGYCGVDNY